MRSLRTLLLLLAARGAAPFAICKPPGRTAALRSPVSDGETSQLVSMRSTVADSESSQQVEIKLAAPAAAAFVETLFEKNVKVKAGTVDKRRTTKRARGQNPIVVGSPDAGEPSKTVDRRRKPAGNGNWFETYPPTAFILLQSQRNRPSVHRGPSTNRFLSNYC